MYHKALGVPQNNAKAILWFEKAAQKKHVVSQGIP
jgi:TPR repeat protein